MCVGRYDDLVVVNLSAGAQARQVELVEPLNADLPTSVQWSPHPARHHEFVTAVSGFSSNERTQIKLCNIRGCVVVLWSVKWITALH